MAVSNLMTVEIVRTTCPPSSKTGQITGEDLACTPGMAGQSRRCASACSHAESGSSSAMRCWRGGTTFPNTVWVSTSASW